MDAEKEVTTKEVGPDTLVICQACQAERPLREFMHEKPVDEQYVYKKTGQLGPSELLASVGTHLAGFREVGLLCPECGDWTHIRYDTAALRRLRGSLDRQIYLMRKNPGRRSEKAYYRAKAKYQSRHDEVQATLRPLLGGQSPTELLGQQIHDIDKLGDEEE